LTDSAKKPDTQSRPKYDLPNASGEELDTIGATVRVSRWNNLRFVPLTTHDSVNLFLPVTKAKQLLDDWNTKFPTQMSVTDPDGGNYEVVRDQSGFYHFKRLPQKYVLIFRKKS
jgi:hypothetical protein